MCATTYSAHPLQTVRGALTEDDADRIVVRVQIVRDYSARAEKRSRAARVDRTRPRLRRVVEEASIEMARIGSDVLKIHSCALPQLPLKVDAPLIFPGVRQLPRGRDHVGRCRGAWYAGRSLEGQRRVDQVVGVGRHGGQRRIVGEEGE